jgi:phosphoribosylformylglycinamidine synthase subunit PurS
MKFFAEIDIMPLKALLDPQGKAVRNSATKAGYEGLENIRIGKHIEVEIDAQDEKIAESRIDELCKKLLSNPIIESYSFKLNKI